MAGKTLLWTKAILIRLKAEATEDSINILGGFYLPN